MNRRTNFPTLTTENPIINNKVAAASRFFVIVPFSETRSMITFRCRRTLLPFCVDIFQISDIASKSDIPYFIGRGNRPTTQAVRQLIRNKVMRLCLLHNGSPGSNLLKPSSHKVFKRVSRSVTWFSIWNIEFHDSKIHANEQQRFH